MTPCDTTSTNVCPVVQTLVNEVDSDAWRTDDDASERAAITKTLAAKIIDTADDDMIAPRAWLCADRAVRFVAWILPHP